MTISTGFCPRAPAEQLARAKAMTAPSDGPVLLDDPGDGWLAAGLKISGKVAVAPSGAQTARCDAALRRLGLGPLGEGLPDPPPGPLVTVLICTYNRAGMVPQAIASALAQRWPVEVVVVDDGSTDDTAGVLAGTPGIRSFRQQPNQGKPAALNRGLAEARGDAVLVLDDDDLLMPGSVAVLAHALFESPDAVAVIGDSIRFHETPHTVAGVQLALRLPGSAMARATLAQVPAMPGATLVRMSAQQAAGAYDLRLNMLEDMDMFLRLAELGQLSTVPLPVQLYRQHQGARGGAADAQVASADRVSFTQNRLARARPVFAERWRARSPIPDRQAAFQWALGLKLRGLHAEATAEASRWPPPFSPVEARIRRRVSLPTPRSGTDGVLVVVHDGDPGALAECLARRAARQSVRVSLEVPVEDTGTIDLHWAAELAPAQGLRARLGAPGPWTIALTSAPDFSPPPIYDAALIPPLTGPRADLVAVLAYALAMGWPEPDRSRAAIVVPAHPLLSPLRAALDAERRGDPLTALRHLTPVLQALPMWKAAWRFAARTATAAGDEASATVFSARGR